MVIDKGSYRKLLGTYSLEQRIILIGSTIPRQLQPAPKLSDLVIDKHWRVGYPFSKPPALRTPRLKEGIYSKAEQVVETKSRDSRLTGLLEKEHRKQDLAKNIAVLIGTTT